MQNIAFERALKSISHPISIGAMAAALLNDHLLRRIAPSWLTGKLGDFAWLIFAPFLIAAVLAWLIPQRGGRRTELVGRISIVLTGLIFGLAKTSPFFHDAVIRLLQAINGWSNNLLIDPTDLLVLPALWISWRIWHTTDRSLTPAKVWPLFVIATLVTTGTSPAIYETGIQQFEERGSSIYSQDFHSEDGGLTWQAGGSTELYAYGQYYSWQLIDPANDRVVYAFNKGTSIDRSDDGGQTWRREFDLSGEQARVASIGSQWNLDLGPFDAIIQRPTGNLIVAMGLEGALVRSAGGEWRWVSVGSFSVPQLKQVDRVVSLLSGELLLGMALIALLVGSLTMRFDLRRIGKSLLLVVLVLILIAAWIYWLLGTSYYDVDLVFGAVTLLLTSATIFFGRRQSRRIKPLAVIAWIALALWGSSSIFARSYGGSFKLVFGLVLIVITLVIGLRPRRRTQGTSFLPTVMVIIFSVLAGGWVVWAAQLSAWSLYFSDSKLFVELSVFFGLATIGLTLFTAVKPNVFSRGSMLLIWGVWLLIGFALVVQFDYLKSYVIEAIVLVALSIGLITVVRRKNLFDAMTRTAIALGWLEWVLVFVVIKPALPNSGFINFTMAIPMIVIPVVLAGAWRAVKYYRQAHSSALNLFLISGAGVLLYLLPFVLWTQGAIPFYDTASLYALGLAIATLIAGKQYVARGSKFSSVTSTQTTVES